MHLGRRKPTDWKHYEKYPLLALPEQRTPVTLGINWYTLFDSPEQDRNGYWWIPRNRSLGSIRGGHAICCEPAGGRDSVAWQVFYDQGQEGACVGFSSSRMMTLLNRKRYDAEWLYHEAQRNDDDPGEDYEGTTVRAAMDVLRKQGHHPILRGGAVGPLSLADGIAANRWATSVDQILAALGTPQKDNVTLLNSWGTGYPHRVHMDCTILQRLLKEDGEATLVTDR